MLLTSSCEKDIDPLDSDVRNAFVGLYKCAVTSCSVNTDTWVQTCDSFIDTIEIAKHEDSLKIKISGLFWGSYNPDVEVDFNIEDSSFSNHHQRVGGRFYFDSVIVHSSISPVSLWNANYIGKKIK